MTASLLLGMVATVAVALTASTVLDPIGATGRAAYEYRPSIPAGEGARDAVTSVEISAAGRGTPGEALLHWWQALQLGMSPERAVADLMAPASPPDAMADALARVRYVFAESKPRLIDHQQRGGRAHVLAVIVTRDASAPGGEVHQLARFGLVRTRGRWRVGPEYVHQRYRAELEFARSMARPGS